MKKIFFALFIFVIVLGISGMSFAHNHHDGDKSIRVQEEAARRNMTLITSAKAQEIAAKQIGDANAKCKELKLRNEADDYPNGTNFRPVYKMEFISGRYEYDVNVDAITGEILKFKLDD